jgi:hypothetical protein
LGSDVSPVGANYLSGQTPDFPAQATPPASPAVQNFADNRIKTTTTQPDPYTVAANYWASKGEPEKAAQVMAAGKAHAEELGNMAAVGASNPQDYYTRIAKASLNKAQSEQIEKGMTAIGSLLDKGGVGAVAQMQDQIRQMPGFETFDVSKMQADPASRFISYDAGNGQTIVLDRDHPKDWKLEKKDPVTDYADFKAEYLKNNGTLDGLSAAWGNQRAKVAGQIHVNVNTPSPEQAASTASSIAEGQLAPSQYNKRQIQAIIPEVKKIYPNFDFTKAEANYKYMTNPQNLATISRVAGVQPRLSALIGQFDQMKNTNMPAFNTGWNAVSKAFGREQVTNFDSNKNAIIQEVNAALSGSNAQTDMRIKLELENLNTSRSPAQMYGALSNLNEALISRQDASTSVPFPWEVVQGKKSLADWKQETQSAQRAPFQAKTNPGASPTAYVYDPATGTLKPK